MKDCSGVTRQKEKRKKKKPYRYDETAPRRAFQRGNAKCELETVPALYFNLKCTVSECKKQRFSFPQRKSLDGERCVCTIL